MRGLPLLALALLLTLTPALSRAQGEPPPVLDPADVFTDAVEVVETLPILNADNEARMLWYFDPAANAWQGYAYPDELESVDYSPGFSSSNIFRRSNGTYVVSSEGFFGFSTPSIDKFWIFNPRDDSLSHPEEACGQMRALPGEGQWVIFQNLETGHYHLCFTETGELSDPLPEELQLNGCDWWRRAPSVSLDGKWVVFPDCSYTNYSLYAYNIETGQINNLGMGGEAESIHIRHWLNNTSFVVSSSVNRNDEFRYLYFADVSQAESMQLIASQWVYEPQYFDDPARYIWLSDAQVHEYNLETREERMLSQVPCDFASCSQIAIPNAPQPSLIAVLDGDPMNEFKRLRIIDVETNQVTFTTTFAGGFGFQEQSSTLQWLDNDTFILFDTLYRTASFPISARLVTLNDQQVAETIVNYLFQAAISPNKRYLLLDDISLGIDRYELQQGAIPIIQPMDETMYDLDLSWQDNDLLLVTISERESENQMMLGRWLIRVP